ncbi:F-actin-capping protein subunit alpha-2-like [Pelodytes ibericus]
MSNFQGLSRDPKVKSVCNLLMQAPPGEFISVLSDIRVLLKNDGKLWEIVKKLCAMHNKKHFLPIQLIGHSILITRHNELGKNRFLDPRGRVLFKFNHMTKQASDLRTVPVQSKQEEDHELWRCAFQESLDNYIKNHYPTGVCNVYCKMLFRKQGIIVCIQARERNASAFWNGQWKSEWAFTLSPNITKVGGYIKIQANYYEGGTIHFSAFRSFEELLPLHGIQEAAKAFAEIVEKTDNKMEAMLMEEYSSFSDTSLKAMRRQLPVTRSTLDWNKLLASRILESFPNL